MLGIVDAITENCRQAREAALREAAKIARDGCLVPPDGGSPTEAEVEVCDRISARILAAI